MNTRIILLTYVSVCVGGLNAVIYDCYTGKPANKTQLKLYAQRNNAWVCTVDIKPCDPEEWQRLDGSCNNPKFPSRGTHRTPTRRVLSSDFEPDYQPRKAADGSNLQLPRRLRTELLSSGKGSNPRITQLLSYYLLFNVGEITSIHDVFMYVLNITHCCKPEGKTDGWCTPVKVPVDDPVHRFSGINCMNLTRPQSFQTYGCLENGTEFVRMEFQTPIFDLSNTYNPVAGSANHLRSFKNGLLIMETENGVLFPPSDPNVIPKCYLNQPPKEKRCNKYHSNISVGPTLFSNLFYRQHNVIAKELCKLNPSWDDERLFFTARDINIAMSQQIFLYELLPLVLGRSNMIRDGIISDCGGFRNLFNENISPQISEEYIYMQRWFHVMQETTMKFYDRQGHFLKTVPLVNVTSRTGFYPLDDHMAQIIQGSFRQPGGEFDTTIDYDMAERVLGGVQLAADVASSDLQKGRFFGFQPYIKYKEFCTKKSYKSFSDLKDSFSPEHLYRLMQNYKSVEHMDLMAAVWLENHVKGGRVPETLYCLVIEQLKRSIASTKHFYESSQRPHAFTEDQLKAIRKSTIAGMLCTVGEGVTEIQPHAFCTISSKNPLTKCSSHKIGKLNLDPWNEDEHDFSSHDNVYNDDDDEEDDEDHHDDNHHHDDHHDDDDDIDDDDDDD